MLPKLKVFISAYACSPYHGSEPGMGWNFVYQISKYHEVHVITEEFKWRDDLERKLNECPSLNQNMKFYFLTKKRNKTLRKFWPPSYYWYYRKWQKEAYKLAVSLDKNEHFDIIHQLNMVGFREPGYLWKIDKPFVWGPIGGMGITSWRLLPSMGLNGFLFYSFRNIINLLQMHYMKRPKKCASHPRSIIIAATEENRDYIRKLWNREAIVISEVGSYTTSAIPEYVPRTDELRICWSGQLTPRKSLNLLLEALSLTKGQRNIKLNVIGDGQRRKAWESKSRKLGLDDKTIWHGWVERQKAIEIMNNCHLFVITSLYDLTSTVLLEAISLGLPVIAPDHCGFTDVITKESGIKIPVHSKKQMVKDLATAIDFIFENEDKRKVLSLGAYQRSLEFIFENKGLQINEIYSELITG